MDKMAWLALAFQAFAFWWGAVFGSFLNVAIYRMPFGLSLVRPGSRCGACGAPVRWYDNLPIVSYLVLRGRCRACKAGYSPRYMLIELASGLMILAVWNAAVMPLDYQTFIVGGLTWLWLNPLVYGLIVLTFIDLEHTWLPDEITYPLIGIGVVGGVALPSVHGVSSVIGAVAGGGFILLVWAIGWAIYRREAMGLGDAKLLAAIGAFLGWQALPFVLLTGAAQALLATALDRLALLTTGKSIFVMTTTELDERFGESDLYADQPVRTAIPFGPFLALGALEALFFGTEWLYALVGQLTGRPVLF
ncbi:MAG: prepilin peptidase [Myxococcales bacterium]|nr:prepilin peptidase [Myxococcales bacterium]